MQNIYFTVFFSLEFTEGIKGSHFDLLNDEYRSEATFDLDATGKGKIYVEFALFGSVPYKNINTPQGCLSTLFLQVLQTRRVLPTRWLLWPMVG